MNKAGRMTLVILLALLIPIIPFAIIGELPGERWLSASDDNALLFGLSGMALLAADVLLPIPSSIVGTMLGARLGFIPGWMWCWLGLMIGNAIGYFTGRLLLARFAPDIPRTPTLVLLFISRPIPVLAEALTFTAGAEKMKFSQFFWAILVGNGLYSVALTGNGAALLPDSLTGPGLILPMLLPVAGWLIWRWMEKRAARRKN